MIVVAGYVRIDPAQRTKALAAAHRMMAATRAEPGCISYVFTADLEDESIIHVFEEWRSAEDLAAHFNSPHMATFRDAVLAMGLRERRVQRYEVTSVAPL